MEISVIQGSTQHRFDSAFLHGPGYAYFIFTRGLAFMEEPTSIRRRLWRLSIPHTRLQRLIGYRITWLGICGSGYGCLESYDPGGHTPEHFSFFGGALSGPMGHGLDYSIRRGCLG
eukprot:6520631-Pyramimonas_sp.AAC.1